MTALSLSPALDLLATTHSDRRGIYLWANQVWTMGVDHVVCGQCGQGVWTMGCGQISELTKCGQ